MVELTRSYTEMILAYGFYKMLNTVSNYFRIKGIGGIKYSSSYTIYHQIK